MVPLSHVGWLAVPGHRLGLWSLLLAVLLVALTPHQAQLRRRRPNFDVLGRHRVGLCILVD